MKNELEIKGNKMKIKDFEKSYTKLLCKHSYRKVRKVHTHHSYYGIIKCYKCGDRKYASEREYINAK